MEGRALTNVYTPHNWVILKIKGDDPHYRVLAGWSGGYLDGSSWRMNSGIVRHEFDEVGEYWYFYGASGSCYRCHKDFYGLSVSIAYVYNSLEKKYGDKVELLDDEVWAADNWDWMETH